MKITLQKSLAVKKCREREALPRKGWDWRVWVLEQAGVRHASTADEERSQYGKGNGTKL